MFGMLSILQTLSGLSHIHKVLQIAHGGLSPDALFISAQGIVKIGTFTPQFHHWSDRSDKIGESILSSDTDVGKDSRAIGAILVGLLEPGSAFLKPGVLSFASQHSLHCQNFLSNAAASDSTSSLLQVRPPPVHVMAPTDLRRPILLR